MIKGVVLEDEKAPVSQLQPMPRGKAGRTITALDAAMTLLFHVVAHSRGASEVIR